MNSKRLIDLHPEVYMEFASNAETILRMPHSISLVGGTACALGGTVLEQKIPLCCYVGIKKTENGCLNFGKYVRYNPNTPEFEYLDFERFETPSPSFIQSLQKLYPNASYEISFLNEIPNKTPDGISFLSVLALEKLENPEFSMERFKIEARKPYESGFIRELIKKTEFTRVEFNETTKGLSSMAGIFLGMAEEFDSTIHKAEVPIPLQRKDEALFFSQSQKRKFLGCPAGESLGDIRKMPFEIILLRPKNGENNSHWYGELANNILGAESMACEIDLAMHASGSSISRRYDLKEGIEMILGCAEMVSLNAFNAIKKHNDGRMVESELFWSLEKAHDGMKHLLGKSNFENGASEKRLFRSLSQVVNEKTFGNHVIYRTGSSIDMNYVILLSKKNPHEEQMKLLGSIEELLSKDFSIIYSSIGDESANLGLEEFSPKYMFGNKGAIETKEIGEDGTRFYQTDFSDFCNAYNGIIIDRDTGKIYLNGIRATSKELPSQQFTVEVLSQISNIGKAKSSVLPFSTYSSSKNEITSKILSPFKKYVKAGLGVDIDWLIDGTETDFQIGIKGLPLKNIVLVKRLNNR